MSSFFFLPLSLFASLFEKFSRGEILARKRKSRRTNEFGSSQFLRKPMPPTFPRLPRSPLRRPSTWDRRGSHVPFTRGDIDRRRKRSTRGKSLAWDACAWARVQYSGVCAVKCRGVSARVWAEFALTPWVSSREGQGLMEKKKKDYVL